MKFLATHLLFLLRDLLQSTSQELDPSPKLLSQNQQLRALCFFRTLDPQKDSHKLEPAVLHEKFLNLSSKLTDLLAVFSPNSKKPPPKLLEFASESAFSCYFLSKLGSRSHTNVTLTREIYRFLRYRGEFPNKPCENFNTVLVFELIKLDFYGFSVPSEEIEDFPLHAAVFSANPCSFHSILLSTLFPIDSLDPLGNSAYKLAIFAKKLDFAQLLLQQNCDTKLRAWEGATTGFELTVFLKERPLLREIFRGILRKKRERWEKLRFSLSETLRNIKDFSCEVRWECDSKYLPFLSRLGLKDTCFLKKKRDSLTIQMNFLGFQRNGLKTGDFLGVFSQSEVYLFEKNTGKTVKIVEERRDEQFLESLVEKTLNSQKKPKEIELKTEKTRFEALKNLQGEPLIEKINEFEAVKYEIKGQLSVKKRGFLQKSPEFASFPKSFREYFAETLQNRVFLCRTCEYSNKEYSVIADLLQKSQRLSRNSKGFLEESCKNIAATLWMIKDFPLNFQQIIPILEILENFSTNLRKFKDFLKTFNYKAYFPIKVCIPLFFSINAAISFTNFEFPSKSPLKRSFSSENLEKLRDFCSENDEDEESLQLAQQKFNSLIKTRNKASVNSDYLNIFEEKDCRSTVFLSNEENIPEEITDFCVQTPRILQKDVKTMVSKNVSLHILREMSPKLKEILKNAIDLNRICNKNDPFRRKIDKETVIWSPSCELPARKPTIFKELDRVLLQQLRGKPSKPQDFARKAKDADVELRRFEAKR